MADKSPASEGWTEGQKVQQLLKPLSQTQNGPFLSGKKVLVLRIKGCADATVVSIWSSIHTSTGSVTAETETSLFHRYKVPGAPPVGELAE